MKTLNTLCICLLLGLGSSASMAYEYEAMNRGLLKQSKLINDNLPMELVEGVVLIKSLVQGLVITFVSETSNSSITSFSQLGSPLDANCANKDVMSGFNDGLTFRYILRNSDGVFLDEVNMDKKYCESL